MTRQPEVAAARAVALFLGRMALFTCLFGLYDMGTQNPVRWGQNALLAMVVSLCFVLVPSARRSQ